MGKNSFSVLNFAAHKVPEFKEQQSKDWILYGTSEGWVNQYPDYLLHIYDRSAKHYAIVNGKVDYVIGQGLSVNEKGLNTEQIARLNKFISEPNPNQTLEDIIQMCSLDLEIFGGFALEILYDKKGGYQMYHAEFAKYRVSKDQKTYYHCNDWKKAKPETIEPIKAFDYNDKSGKQLLYLKAYHPKADYYPLPPYLGAIPYIELDSEIANFHLNSVKNGFVAGFMFNFFNGQPTEEEQETIEARIESKFCGTDNANRILLNFNDSKEQAVEVLPLGSNDFDARFDILNKKVQQEIFSGHSVVDPALFGIKEDGVFATRTQVRDSYELFKNTYVRARQDFIMNVFNELAALQGFEKRIQIIPSEPISEGYSEATKVGVMTTNEIREAVGLPSLDTAQVKEVLKLKSEIDAEDLVAEAFCQTGYSLDEWEIVKPIRKVRFRDEKDQLAFEDRVMKFGVEQDSFLMGILEQLKQNPTVTYAGIAELLGVSIEEIAVGVNELVSQGLLTVGTESVAGATQIAYEVSTNGLRELTQAKPLGAQFKIAYHYVISQEAQADPDPAMRKPIIPSTRAFCRRMVMESERRVWTSEQIQGISMQESRNTWMRRGGFWTRRGGGITTSYCRHAWESVVIKSRA
jgi:phage portal protein BeeE